MQPTNSLALLILTGLAALGALAFAAPPALAQDSIFHLAVGDPARRDREAPVVLDAVTDTRDNATLTPTELAARLSKTRLLLIGEEHTNVEFHRVQLHVLESLVAAGRSIMIGLEMYPYTAQGPLDQWPADSLSEDDFIRVSRWYEHWGYNWQYYRDIFLLARRHRIPMHAVNTPREVVSAIRKKGLSNLTPEEAAHVPKKIDADNPDHMAFFKASFEGAEGPVHGPGMSDEVWKNMLAAQATWDATMGWNAVEALKRQGGADSIMVVLVGSGHVAYDLGISRQVRKWFDGPVATLIPVPVTLGKAGAIKSVRASYADFIWGVPEEHDSLHPSLGISTAVGQGEVGRRVLVVQKDSPGALAGFKPGDVLVSMDGTPLPDKETYNRLMAAKRWGDTATFVVRRDGAEVTLRALFRRSPPEPA